MNPIDEEPTVRPGDLAREFKERTHSVVSEDLPEKVKALLASIQDEIDTPK
jgi:hypothetical protein